MIMKDKHLTAAIAITLFLTTTFVINGCKEKPKPTAPPVYKVQQMVQTTGNINMRYATTIESSQVVEVRPRVEGYLDKIYVEEGGRVRKGDPLFLINQDDFNQRLLAASADVLTAESSLYNAELEIEKITPLVEQNIVSEFQLKTAESNLRAAKARLAQSKAAEEQARINLGYTLIKAPVSGSISKISIREGALVRVSDPNPLTIISADGDVFAYFAISETLMNPEKAHIVNNLPEAQLRLSSGHVYEEKGRLELASGIVNSQTGTILLKAVFSNKSNQLKTGLSGEVIIPIAVPNSILVPKLATFEMLNKTMVVTVDANNTTASREITILGSDGDNYIVTGGVKAGDRIVTEGVRKLHDGTVITPENIN